MTRPGPRRTRWLWPLVVPGLLVAVLAPAGGASALPAVAPAVAVTEPTARVDLTAVGPALLTPAGTITVTGRITNTGAVPLELVGARLRLGRAGLGTRSRLAAWDAGTDPSTGTVVGPTLDVEPRSIPVAASAAFTLSVRADELGLAGRAFGAYGVAVEVRAQGREGRQQVGLARSTVVWQPGAKEYAAQQLAWLVPITATALTATTPTVEDLAALVGPGSRLRRVLAAASVPGVGWALDPALLLALDQALAPGPPASPDAPAATPTATPADTSAATVIAAFLADLRAAAPGRVVVELPYADPDLVAATRGGRTDLVRSAQAAGAGVVRQLVGVTPVTGVGWPADGWAGEDVLRSLSSAGTRTVVLDGRARRLVDALPYTADARALLASGVTGWLADARLSALAASATAPAPARVQRLLAETAAATSERPGLTRRLLVVAPRDLDPDPAAFAALVAAAAAAPWLDVVPVTDLAKGPPGAVVDDTADLPRLAVAAPPAVDRAALAAAHVAAVRRSRGALAALGEVVADPFAVTGDLQRATLRLLSTAWRGHPDELVARRAVVAADVRGLTDGVRVLTSSVNFLASSGRLQITVVNDLPEAVSGLRLRVTSTNPRLRVERTDVTTPDLAAGTRAQVQVPVQAIASGRVRLNAQLVSPSGRSVGQTVPVQVRAQPTGTWALWVLGAVAALVLLVGLVRALRRPRRRRAVAP